MSLSSIAQRIETTAAVSRLRSWVDDAQAATEAPALHVTGAAGSVPAFLLYYVHTSPGAPLCILVPDEDAAAYLQSDLEQLVDDSEEQVLRVPATKRPPYDPDQITDSTPLIERADALQRLAEGFDGLLVTSVEAAGELVPPPEAVKRETLAVKKGEEISLEALADRLVEQDFSPVEFVEEPGEFARRGGILDVFPYAGSYPVRIDFFGDEIDSLREFDPQTQRSVSRLTTARLVPNLEREAAAQGSIPLFEYLSDDVVLATVDESQIREGVQAQYDEAVASVTRPRCASRSPSASRTPTLSRPVAAASGSDRPTRRPTTSRPRTGASSTGRSWRPCWVGTRACSSAPSPTAPAPTAPPRRRWRSAPTRSRPSTATWTWCGSG